MGRFSTLFRPFHSKWGQHESLNKGVDLCHETFTKFSSTQSLLSDTEFPRFLLNLIRKRLANKESHTASKLTSKKHRSKPELTSHLRVQFFEHFFPTQYYDFDSEVVWRSFRFFQDMTKSKDFVKCQAVCCYVTAAFFLLTGFILAVVGIVLVLQNPLQINNNSAYNENYAP